MKLDLKTISAGLGILITIVTTTYGGYRWLNGNFASASAMEEVKASVQAIKVERTLEKLYDEYYFLQKKLREDPSSEELKRKVQELKVRIDRMEDRLKSLQEKAKNEE